MPEHTPAPTPHRAVYGFAFFVFFAALFAFYLGWALLPDALLADRLGLRYMPDKYFVLFLPVVIMFALTIFGFVVYPAWNYSGTFEPTDERTLRDAASIWRCGWRSVGESGAVEVGCERRVEAVPEDGWAVPRYCERHAATGTGQAEGDDGVGWADGAEESVRIENYCDCVQRERCVLQQRPQHVAGLLARRTVPSVCDLDASEVSARLFGAGRPVRCNE